MCRKTSLRIASSEWRIGDPRLLGRPFAIRHSLFALLHPSLAGLVVLAGSLYPIPSRTRPLNSPAPMVLSLKAWKSRSLPGLPRTETSSRSRNPRSRRGIPAAAFCVCGTRRRGLHGGDTVDLHVERPVPGRDADEAARRRVGREIARIDRVDRRKMRG